MESDAVHFSLFQAFTELEAKARREKGASLASSSSTIESLINDDGSDGHGYKNVT